LEIKRRLSQVPGFSELTVVRELGQPSLLIDVDREKIARYGINVADVEAIVQAAVGGQADGRDVIRADGVVLDLARRAVEVRGASVELTYVEFELLRTLAARPGRVFSRQALLEALWGDYAYREPRTIDVHVRHLREKLEVDPHEPDLIQTVRGVGYRLRG
jgi:DNA-binding response OmpR family regulator